MKKVHFSLAAALLSAALTMLVSPLSAQQTTGADKEPEYPGGFPALVDFLMKNVQYPAEAKKEGAEGVVLVKFMVGKDGGISGIKTVSEQSRNPRADFVREAVRVVKMMPRWNPAEVDGKAVAVEMALPVQFILGKKTP